ncbi:heavy metal-binding domain-containing protein [Brumimicrobium salinarum]|uniref:heavy metal-binding domain-containing protein n=1 Tax=Brumimicrobium salinarum TaxID=2058658 RepID=UPI00196B22F9|nr:heavy metal-binding domain-containing protein [Brumimicrobium salinarum]
MKKVKILMATGAFFLSGMMFTACGSETATTEAEEQTANSEVYQCPMDCEEGKTYEEPGQCPVCEMDLKKVES